MSANIRTIKDIRYLVSDQLGSLYPEKEIEALTGIIIKTLFNVGRLHMFNEDSLNITPAINSRLLEIVRELKTGRPVQYILGETVFYDCRINVNESVLIPRQETEELVDLIVRENRDFKGRVTDIGTGSGCIAIALAKNIPDAVAIGTDISDEALKTAADNSRLNEVNVTFIKSDILRKQPIPYPKAKILVSNPPYVRESEKQHMHKNVLGFEPVGALFVPDNDPLIYYRHILESVPELTEQGSMIYFEINEAMGFEMRSLMNNFGIKDISVLKDLSGKDRIVKGKYYGS